MDATELIAVAVAGGLLTTAVGYVVKLVFSLSNRVTALETGQAPLIKILDELRADVKCIDRKLNKLIGRQDADDD